ncbi:uncharacterized protein K452DRAFT_308334 [Aplosporella prunicola CBS 121167]|uniref:DUF7770 domain-containing protein n=1 Tax=Aplosporella prunicola CBS 121167 TaxID=1176127 RepID=A0A6A6BF51_9PEZI|nr:uncharacterized protein K452DRAFT_308334 [Aplosporella prunicola CBS 121167]KAF2142696.1 hypothetical protein K452DRAFT_308334 [Aplosporella prunicola CBS 121167]
MSNPCYIPPSLYTTLDNLNISRITVAGHEEFPVAPESDINVNHWAIYLEVTEGGHVCLDMIPTSSTGGLANLAVSRLPTRPSNVVKTVEFPTDIGLSVKRVIERIEGERYHIYRYGNEMLECRYWVYVVWINYLRPGGSLVPRPSVILYHDHGQPAAHDYRSLRR